MNRKPESPKKQPWKDRCAFGNCSQRLGLAQWAGALRWTFRQGIWIMLVGLLSVSALEAQTVATDRGSDEIARVNGVVITRRAFQIEYRQAVDRHARDGHPINEAYIAPIRRKVVQTMIEDELLFQESRRQGIVVSAAQIDSQVAAARARFDDGAAFEKELARQYMDETQYRRKLHRQSAIAQLIERQVTPSLTVSEEEIRRFFDANPQRYQTPETVRVSHIMIRIPAGSDPQDAVSARRKMETIMEKLAQGEDFAALAKQYSEAPGREQGGDIGYVRRHQMIPELDTLVFDLKTGETSPVVTTGNGLHLVRVVDRRPAQVTSFEDARADIRDVLLQLKRDRAVQDLVAALKETADIRSAY